MAGSLPLLGAIADDYTGATDLAGMLRQGGIRVIQILGLQPDLVLGDLPHDCQAVVTALKSRSAPRKEACAMAVHALEQLQRFGAKQIYFKYCSTFDSTADGNIGPVIDKLMEAMQTDFTVSVPALPINGRTQYCGHLFVGSALLSDSSMRHHPLTPMTDSNLVRFLQLQTQRRVGLIPYAVVSQGAKAVRAGITSLKQSDIEIALVDVLNEDDLTSIASAVVDFPLITGGSGLGMKLPGIWRALGRIDSDELVGLRDSRHRASKVLCLSGSCSAATLEQIRRFRACGYPAIQIDAMEVLTAKRLLDQVADRAAQNLNRHQVCLVFSSTTPEDRENVLAKAQAAGYSANDVRSALEDFAAELARRVLEESRDTSLVIAGGETSGAILESLQVTALEIGLPIDPGVPLCQTVGSKSLKLILKSGNFGSEDFFAKAVRYLLGDPPILE